MLLRRVGQRLPMLRAAEGRVAEVLLADPSGAARSSVAALAARAGTSTATVVRCAQKFGFRGYHELRTTLARELAGTAPTRGFAVAVPADPRLAALSGVTENGARAVGDAAAHVDAAAFAAAVTALDGAERVLIAGVGGSAPLCQDGAARLGAIGLRVEAPADPQVQQLRARLLGVEDLCLALSYSGRSLATLGIVAAAAASGATTIAITSATETPLAIAVGHPLVVADGAAPAARLALATRLAQLAVLDALIVAVAGRDEARTRRSLRR